MIWSMPGNDVLDPVHRGVAFEDPEQEAREYGAGQAAHAADHDDDEAEHEEIHAHVEVGRVDRGVHRARHASHGGGEAEHQGEAAVNVDAEQAHGFTVCHAGADHHAEGGEAQEREDRPDDAQREQEIDHPPVGIDDGIGRKADPDAEVERACEFRRRGGRDGVRAEEIFDDFLHHDREAEGYQDLVGMRAFVEVLDQAAFHDEAEKHHDRNCEEDRQRHRPVDDGGACVMAEPGLDIGRLDLQRVAEKILLGRVERVEGQAQHALHDHGAEGAEHEHRAMGEVRPRRGCRRSASAQGRSAHRRCPCRARSRFAGSMRPSAPTACRNV